jgi:hypothetical protein
MAARHRSDETSGKTGAAQTARRTHEEVDMDAERIVKISLDAIRELIESQQIKAVAKGGPGNRRDERWPFPGTVELWLPEECYGERHVLATLHNLSLHGLGMRTRRPIPVETKLSIALHQPELSCYGHAIVRHCTQAHVGYLVGCEFIFPSDEAD